ncbi:hypothetical protein LV716_16820 [Flagellimonas sp. HMM57]|uniref:hypothetical protein n=1 Tax=unclassified Flagellimonas TaxID=2644544 RepID=UPI0013D7834A|nr:MULTISPECIES: hypothetical protein [unclassified Flagellimonas]UII75905.1 hypothetical protein LV716_16820 [Flagellimonas sp. HMM57]
MKSLSKTFNWKRTNILIAVVLLILIGLNFYGPYTNKFYIFKLSNYILPLLSIVHFLYMYVIWFKIKEEEIPDPQMRNLEYGLYAVLLFYIFKMYDVIVVLGSSSQYQQHLIAPIFKPMVLLSIALYGLLIVLTLFSFWQRKHYIGGYNFEKYNDINIWQ